MILVTGGCRSGKSAFAEKLSKQKGDSALYIATAIPFDNEMKDRIDKHQQRRPKEWETWEGNQNIAHVIEEKSVHFNSILLDCVTIWITNLMFAFSESPDVDKMDFISLEEKIIEEVKKVVDSVKKQNVNMIFVTNEIGLGVIPENKFGRYFRDVAGKINQYLASESDEVYFVVSGIPMKIKGD